MRVGRSIEKALIEWENGDFESSMLHACNAVDGTAKKRFPTRMHNKRRFTNFIRSEYDVVGPMGAPGLNLHSTRFPVRQRSSRPDAGHPDIADILYNVHRCSHGHGDELPDGFELLPDTADPQNPVQIVIGKNEVYLSNRVIIGLLAASVFAPENIAQEIDRAFYLSHTCGLHMPIHEWWGKKSRFLEALAETQTPSVHLDFGDWMVQTELPPSPSREKVPRSGG